MGCCGEIKKDRPIARIVQYEERSCTDVLFILLYFAAWFGMIIVFSRAVDRGGDPDRIIKPTDWLGRTCGKSAGVEDLKWGAWPNPIYYSFQVCLSDCNQTLTSTNMSKHYFSTEFVNYCIPSLNGTVTVSLSGDFESASESASRAVGDLFTAWVIILASAFVALPMSYFYAWLCEKFAGLMVFLAIIFIVVGGFLIGYVFIDLAKKYDTTDVANRAKLLKGFGYACVICTVLFILVMFFLRERIKIAIAIVKEAADAINDMRSIVMFPLIPVFIGLAYMVWWIAVALYIMSVGSDIQVETPAEFVTIGYPANYTDFKWDQQLKNSFALHFFHLLWNIQFFVYFTYLVCAGAIADWYFTPYDANGNKKRGDGYDELSYTPVKDSFCRTLRYHMGTVALGSFIIAVIQMIRYTVKYLEEQSRAAKGEPNRLQKFVMSCIHCCLWCAECCMDKINKHAFVWTAIYGDSFTTAACSSFALIWNNLLRVAAITVVSAYLIILGKLVVSLLTTGVAALVMANYPYYEQNLNSIIMPCSIIFLLSYLVASLFMAVFETTIDTTFICFLVDEENNRGGVMLASKGLRDVVDNYADASKKEMERQHTLQKMRSQNLGRPVPAANNAAGVQPPSMA